ncbi:hypothetical protein COX22_03060 [Candidatus Falkowbacteria bacterium CG23_combo_of_CG06-09_8_20_14_all_49_15]|uniref:Transposase IS200-like domain-containing protein n=1 Tax=Candidatus Falkowbacteria bacterium CG23_combo_of_CG06-09_8_20_14_all_49_15 TaxID=1974572 RepID=A0A2G9ZKI9_9BACT|nr:MAG: hypothetical protein COX22_03060 [Candidatus Falkowbacteria bacterium CG23_combo_of_CG06-09_8_20_14_all_49_15]
MTIEKLNVINRVPKKNGDLYKNKYRIKSARRPGYDYAHNGYYFITICTVKRTIFFGAVTNGLMILNDAGRLAEKFWHDIPGQFSSVLLDAFCIMPDHIHGLIFIDKDLTAKTESARTGGAAGQYNPMGKKTLGEIIRWYKGRCTFEIRMIKPGFAWQARFYDHIVRDRNALNKIRQYIINNPNNQAKSKNYQINNG